MGWKFEPEAPIPPYYWPTMGGKPADMPPTLEELEEYERKFKAFKDRIINDAKNKDKDKDKDKKKGLSSFETFIIMAALSPVIGWAMSGLYRASLLGIAHNIGLQ